MLVTFGNCWSFGEEIGEKLKGRSLKSSFDKACALTCRFLRRSPPHPPPPPPHPFPFSLIFHRKTAPEHPPEPDPKPLPQGHQWALPPLCENYPGKNYPLVSARCFGDENSLSLSFAANSMVSSLWHTNNRLRGTH